MAKLRWYRPRSTITTKKTEANRIAKKLRGQGNFKNVHVVPRTLKADSKTKSPKVKGYWLKVNR